MLSRLRLRGSSHSILAISSSGNACQAFSQQREVLTTAFQELRRAAQLLDTDRGRDLAHAIVKTKFDGVVLPGEGTLRNDVAIDSERPQAADAVQQVGPSRDHHPALAGRDVLDRVERKAADVAVQSDVRAVEARTQRQRAVLDNRHTVSLCHALEGRDVNRKAGVVHDCDRPRARAGR